VIAAALGSLLAFQASSDAPTLAALLRTSPERAALVVDPERVLAAKGANGLAAFNRKAVQVGSLRAVVPATIAAFDDDLAQPPDLYDGLPREAKLLYLLTTLTPAQIRRAASPGLTIDDLEGESRKVFASLLPKPLRWRAVRVAAEGLSSADEGTVEGDDLRKVRVQVVRKLDLGLIDPNDPNSSETLPTSLYARFTPGTDLERVRRGDDDQKSDAAFGAAIRRTAENRPKRGALDTRRFAAPVAVGPKATIGSILAAVGRGGGTEILADAAVRDLPVLYGAGTANGGDLLDALALAVGGTYRRVGSAYLLTSDTLGRGARQLLVNAWEEGVRGGIERRQEAWREALKTRGALSGLGYAADDPAAPDERMRGGMAAHPNVWRASTLPIGALTPNLRAFVAAFAKADPSRGIRPDAVTVGSSFTYRFVLPDGRRLEPEYGGLGDAAGFDREAPPFEFPGLKEGSAPFDRERENPDGPILFRADAAPEASAAAALARSYGFREIWLETQSPEALAPALASGLAVRLVLRPWAWRSAVPPGGADRTILGDRAVDFERRLKRSAQTMDYLGRPLFPRRVIEETIAPDAPEWPAHVARLAKLARTPGLKGVVLVETAPPGYDGPRPDGFPSTFPPRRVAATAFGYTEGQRLAHLRREGVDPIDLGWSALMGSVDLRPSFFPDPNLQARSSPGVSPELFARAKTTLPRWDEARRKTNVAALRRLLDALPREVSTEVEVPHPYDPSNPLPTTVFTPWGGAGPLPSGGLPENAPYRQTMPLGSTSPDVVPQLLFLFRQALAAPSPARGPWILDLSGLPSDAWKAALGRALTVPTPRSHDESGTARARR